MKRQSKAGNKASPRNGKRDTNNLVALGSAAVLAIYGAGYARTKPAADRFANESNDRRPVSQSTAMASRATDAGTTRAGTSANVHDTSTAASQSGDAVSPIATAAAAGGTSISATSASATTKAAPIAAVSVSDQAAHPTPHQGTKQAGDAAAKSTTTTGALAESTTSTASTTPTAPSAPSSIPVTTTPDSAATQTASQAADSAAAKVTWRDGAYFGWGTSRHGDIEAKVEIKDGRIVSAEISQCLTRYSCSWIAHLPPQVLTRQSAEVDYVSGATQSSNAFYYAVLGALNRAR